MVPLLFVVCLWTFEISSEIQQFAALPAVSAGPVAELDFDGDGVPDAADGCPNDARKRSPGACGCGVEDLDRDHDGVADCIDACPDDPTKVAPGDCGCGAADSDRDGDGVSDCIDLCPDDPAKRSPGVCGCGTSDVDTDADGIADCVDNCPQLANSTQDDCDGDGVGDACELASGASPDCNANGIPDACEEDRNRNGIPDDCDLASGFSLDLDSDGVPDDAEGTSYEFCAGDSEHCPDGRDGGFRSGCANSTGLGAHLYNVGGHTHARDDAQLIAIHLPSRARATLLCGIGESERIFGAGRLCLGANLRRFEIAAANEHGVWSSTALVAQAQGAIQRGSTWGFQLWYRDARTRSNLSNAVQITFQ